MVPFKHGQGASEELLKYYNAAHSRLRSRVERVFAWQKVFKMLYMTDKDRRVVSAAARLVCGLQHWSMRDEPPKYAPLIEMSLVAIRRNFDGADDCDCSFESDDDDEMACTQLRLRTVQALMEAEYQLPVAKRPAKRGDSTDSESVASDTSVSDSSENNSDEDDLEHE